MGVKVVDVGWEKWGDEHTFVSGLISQIFFWADHCPKLFAW